MHGCSFFSSVFSENTHTHRSTMYVARTDEDKPEYMLCTIFQELEWQGILLNWVFHRTLHNFFGQIYRFLISLICFGNKNILLIWNTANPPKKYSCKLSFILMDSGKMILYHKKTMVSNFFAWNNHFIWKMETEFLCSATMMQLRRNRICKRALQFVPRNTTNQKMWNFC